MILGFQFLVVKGFVLYTAEAYRTGYRTAVEHAPQYNSENIPTHTIMLTITELSTITDTQIAHHTQTVTKTADTVTEFALRPQTVTVYEKLQTKTESVRTLFTRTVSKEDRTITQDPITVKMPSSLAHTSTSVNLSL